MFPPPVIPEKVVSEAEWLLGAPKRRNHWDLRLADR